MKYKWLDNHLLSQKKVVKEYQNDWKAYKYMVSDKMFAMYGTDKTGKDIITLKLDPDYGRELREHYKGIIIPGYYMNKDHWNSIYLENDISKKLISELVDLSYGLVFNSLTKKKQKEINGE